MEQLHPIQGNEAYRGATTWRARDAARVSMNSSFASPRRVLLVASAGGHWLELCRISPALKGFDCQFVSTAAGLVAPVGTRRVLQLPDGSRETIVNLIASAWQFWRILRAFQPDIVITTGAAPGAVALVVAGCAGVQVVWVESMTSADELSLSGRCVRRIADLCIVQWPQLAERDASLHYFGKIV